MYVYITKYGTDQNYVCLYKQIQNRPELCMSIEANTEPTRTMYVYRTKYRTDQNYVLHVCLCVQRVCIMLVNTHVKT